MTNEIINIQNLSTQELEALQGEINTRRFKALETKTEKLDKRVTKIEFEAPVSSAISNYLTRKRRKRVIEWLGGKGSKAYKHRYGKDDKQHYQGVANKTFAEMERDFKEKFQINNYADLPKKDKEAAEEYIALWDPSTNVRLEIQQINNQLELLSKEA